MASLPFHPGRVPVFYGWPIMVVGALGVLMSVPGQTIGVSVFIDHLIVALGLSRGQLSVAYMLGTIGSACLLPMAGKICDRVGVRSMAVAASVAMSLVLVFLASADVLARGVGGLLELPPNMVAFAVISLAFLALRFFGQGVLTLASQTMVAKWFNRKRGTVSGISAVGVAIGFSLAPPMLNWLIGEFGWRGAWIGLAAFIGGVFSLLALALYRDNPEDCGLRPDGGLRRPSRNDPKSLEEEPCWTRGQAVRTGVFWVFSLSLALQGLYITGFSFHVVSVFETSGMTRGEAVMVFLPSSIIAVLTHLFAGWFSDRMPLPRLLAVMLLAMAMSMLALGFFGAGLPFWIVVAGNGVAGGLFGLLTAVSWARFFGRRHLGSINGFHMSVTGLCSALGPVLFSQSLAWTGAYGLAGLACATAALTLFFWALKIGEPPKLPRERTIVTNNG